MTSLFGTRLARSCGALRSVLGGSRPKTADQAEPPAKVLKREVMYRHGGGYHKTILKSFESRPKHTPLFMAKNKKGASFSGHSGWII